MVQLAPRSRSIEIDRSTPTDHSAVWTSICRAARDRPVLGSAVRTYGGRFPEIDQEMLSNRMFTWDGLNEGIFRMGATQLGQDKVMAVLRAPDGEPISLAMIFQWNSVPYYRDKQTDQRIGCLSMFTKSQYRDRGAAAEVMTGLAEVLMRADHTDHIGLDQLRLDCSSHVLRSFRKRIPVPILPLWTSDDPILGLAEAIEEAAGVRSQLNLMQNFG